MSGTIVIKTGHASESCHTAWPAAMGKSSLRGLIYTNVGSSMVSMMLEMNAISSLTDCPLKRKDDGGI